jgi:hypothetical protein
MLKSTNPWNKLALAIPKASSPQKKKNQTALKKQNHIMSNNQD